MNVNDFCRCDTSGDPTTFFLYGILAGMFILGWALWGLHIFKALMESGDDNSE